jgi:hypothetical protein
MLPYRQTLQEGGDHTLAVTRSVTVRNRVGNYAYQKTPGKPGHQLREAIINHGAQGSHDCPLPILQGIADDDTKGKTQNP